MKNWLWKGIVAAAIALPALSGIARAEGCTKATLNGAYAFSVVDFATPFVVVGIGHFDGNGGFSQADYRGDSLRTMGARDFARGETGSYTVNPDCTGTQLIHLNVPLTPGAPFGASHGEIENRFVISNGGRSIHGVVARGTPPGQTQAQPTQTRVDFWKVASEQDN
jgi:hypothetical protein